MTDRITPDDDGLGYEIKLAGHLGGQWSTWFGGLTITHEEEGTTTLRGPVADQAQLHGLLARVRDLGTSLISVSQVDNRNSGFQERHQSPSSSLSKQE